jgi:hypothetical protein
MNLKATEKHTKRKLQKIKKKMVITLFSLNRKKVKYAGQPVVQLIAKSIDQITFLILTINRVRFRIVLMKVYHLVVNHTIYII